MIIIIIKKSGEAIKIDSNDLPLQKRGGRGIKIIQVEKNDEVVAAITTTE